MRPFGDLPGDDPERDARRAAEEDRQRAEERRETAAALEAAGIELDPTPPGTVTAISSIQRSRPSARSRGSRSAARHRDRRRGGGGHGAWRGAVTGRIHAVASRDASRRERFRGLVTVERAFIDAQALVEEVELIILAVPDDALAPLAARSGCTARR